VVVVVKVEIRESGLDVHEYSLTTHLEWPGLLKLRLRAEAFNRAMFLFYGIFLSTRETRQSPGVRSILLIPDLERILQPVIPYLNTSSVGSGLGTGQVHPAIQALGVKYAKGVITGGHSRCLAFVNAMEEVFGDFVMTVGATSPETDSFGLDCQEAELGIFAIILTTLDSAVFVVREQDMNNAQQIHRELSKVLNRCVQFVVECRPLSVSMGNFVRYLKEQIAHLPLVLSLPEARKLILEAIDLFREKRLLLPVKEIAAIGSKLIGHGEKIVVYAYSEVVLNLLKQYASSIALSSIAQSDNIC